MIRVLHVSLALLVLTGHALAQVTPSAATPPRGSTRSGSGGFSACRDRPLSPRSARGRDPPPHARGADAGERGGDEVDRLRQVEEQTAAGEI